MQGIVLVYGARRAAGEPRSSTSPLAAARSPLDDPGELSRWQDFDQQVASTATGIAPHRRGGRHGVALARSAAHAARRQCRPRCWPPCCCWRSSRRSCGAARPTRSTPTRSCRDRRRAHWVGTDNLGRDIFYRVLVATRLSVELAFARDGDRRGRRACCSARRRMLVGRRFGRLGRGDRQRRGGVPRPAARAVLRGDLRRRREGRRARDRTRRGARVRATHPDPRRRRGSRATSSPRPASPASAAPGSCGGTCCRTSPSRWSSTPRSAPAGRCSPSPGCRSSVSACSRRTTTGDG